MKCSRLYTDQLLDCHQTVILSQQQSHYLTHVLRLKKDHEIILFNGLKPLDYRSKINAVGKRVELVTIEAIVTHKESNLRTTIYQALSKNEHVDLTIQKCTELGVHSIIIFNSERTQIPLKANKKEKKLEHWQRIAQSACEQCGRSIIPKIHFTAKLNDALFMSKSHTKLMLDFNGSSIQDIINDKTHDGVDILLGAEGGLSSNEIFLADQFNFKKVRLGPRVLRTETAAISALSLIQMLAGDLC